MIENEEFVSVPRRIRFLRGLAAAVALVIGLGATLGAILALGSSNAATPPPPTCSYVQAGSSGPKDNVLRIKGPGVLYRSGMELKVKALLGKKAVTSCSGGVPTTRNVDRIHVIANSKFILDEGNGGPLAPGATRESRGSEIEIAAEFGRPNHALLKIWGARRGNVVNAVSLKRGAIGINLNGKADGRSADLDLITQRTRLLKFLGGPGPDRLSGVGLRSFAKNPKGSGYNPFSDRLRLLGKGGDDVLLGSPGRDFLLAGIGAHLFRGGRGNDLVIGGRGAMTYSLERGRARCMRAPAAIRSGSSDGLHLPVAMIASLGAAVTTPSSL